MPFFYVLPASPPANPLPIRYGTPAVTVGLGGPPPATFAGTMKTSTVPPLGSVLGEGDEFFQCFWYLVCGHGFCLVYYLGKGCEK